MKLFDILRESRADDKYNELLNDKQYMNDLVSDMLDSEGKKDTPENRKDTLSRAKGKYLRDIVKSQVKDN